MLECKECKFDEVNDLEYCGEHILNIKCIICDAEFQVFYESDYNEMMDGKQKAECISCMIDNRIAEIEHERRNPKIKYSRAEVLEFFQIWFGDKVENMQS